MHAQCMRDIGGSGQQRSAVAARAADRGETDSGCARSADDRGDKSGKGGGVNMHSIMPRMRCVATTMAEE